MTTNNPDVIMGMRADRSPWVIHVDFGHKITLDSMSELKDGRETLSTTEARARASALIAAADWIDNNQSQKLESEAAKNQNLG